MCTVGSTSRNRWCLVLAQVFIALLVGGVIVLASPRRAPTRASVVLTPTGAVAAGSF